MALLMSIATIAYTSGAEAATTGTQLKARLVTLSQFPQGWQKGVPSSGSGVTATGCLNHAINAKPPKHQVTVSASFSDPTAMALFGESLKAGPGVLSALTHFSKVLSGCRASTLKSGDVTMQVAF